MAKFINFEAVMGLATIEEIADRLNLDVKPHGRQLRGPCPVHGGDDRTLCISPGVKSKRGSLGVFFCMKASEGGDRLGLVAHCEEIGQQDAAYFIQSHFGDGNSNSDSEQSQSTVTVDSTVSKPHARPAPPGFDPEKFKAKLAYGPEIKAMGLTEDDATQALIGLVRGQVHIPRFHPSGAIAGWWKLSDGKLVAPSTWLPDAANVVKLRRA